MIQYNEEGNFDRIIAAELAVAMAMKLDPVMGRVGAGGDARIQAMYSKKKSNKLFGSSNGLFSETRKNKLFT
jgi:hypothetical protein